MTRCRHPYRTMMFCTETYCIISHCRICIRRMLVLLSAITDMMSIVQLAVLIALRNMVRRPLCRIIDSRQFVPAVRAVIIRSRIDCWGIGLWRRVRVWRRIRIWSRVRMRFRVRLGIVFRRLSASAIQTYLLLAPGIAAED